MAEETTKVFDATKEIELGMRVESNGSVVVRWPTDDEWLKRMRSRKLMIRRLGRGMSETTPPEPSEGDLALYEKIKLNGATPLTKAEAFQVAETLSTCAVHSVEIEGDQALISMTVLTGDVKFRMKIPSAAQVIACRRGAFRLIDLPFSAQEVRINPEAGARLFDECRGASDDYAGPIPAIHKDAAARAVMEQLERSLGPAQNDADF